MVDGSVTLHGFKIPDNMKKIKFKWDKRQDNVGFGTGHTELQVADETWGKDFNAVKVIF